MNIELVSLDNLLLGGLIFYGDPLSTKGGWDEENEIGRTCKRFIDYISRNPERAYSSKGQYLYEVHVYNDETAAKGIFEVFIGEEVNTFELPVELSLKYIPASRYLKITLSGKEITGDWWQKLDEEIIPGSGFKRNPAYIIEAYDDRFKGMDNIEASELDVFLPLEKVCV